jgi:hypothetical protein
MNYQQSKTITLCLAIMAFLCISGLVFIGLRNTGVGLPIMVAGPIALGVCGAIVVFALAAPFNRRLLTRALKTAGSSEQLAAWFGEKPPRQFYVGPNGAWLDGEKYYWGHSLDLELEDVSLKELDTGFVLVIKLGKTLDKSTHHFMLQVPVPKGREREAEEVRSGLLKENIVLDEKGERRL